MSEPPYGPSYPPYPQQRRPTAPPGYGPAPSPARPRPPAVRPDPETASQVRAAYAARAELGPEYDDPIAAGLVDRVEELVAHRTAELRRADEVAKEDRQDARSRETHRFVLGIISLGAGIPITAIAASSVEPGLFGVIAAWAGIVGVNAVTAWGGRRRRD